MKITRERVEQFIKKDGRSLHRIEVTYGGKGKKVRCDRLDHINWDNVKSVVIEFDQSRLEYVRFDWYHDEPVLRDSCRKKIRT